jgi:hypothetical protein
MAPQQKSAKEMAGFQGRVTSSVHSMLSLQ